MKLLIFAFVALFAIASAKPTTLKAGFQELSPENILKLRHLTKDDNAEEYSGQFEGDIVLSKEQLSALLTRNGLLDHTYRWKENTVPYVIANNTFSDVQKNYIRRGLDQLQLVSCLKFVERTVEEDYIEVIGTPTGCWSEVGKIGGKQQLNLQLNNVEEGCFRIATIMHEFIHALGFYHMQSTYDRDDYVEIKWDNITPGMEHNFEKYSSQIVGDFDITYDYNSVMHYGATGFSENGLPTIVPKVWGAPIGQRVGLSRKDIEKLNRMYECPW
ncbi:seminal metalloprotease 1-like [Culicoides brevitarsis]|uniref:seminal metalloprotease 1-like n=1 Tax=Culicoides brevitarsis TaxID=469753 RepID=UPI00307B720A